MSRSDGSSPSIHASAEVAFDFKYAHIRSTSVQEMSCERSKEVPMKNQKSATVVSDVVNKRVTAKAKVNTYLLVGAILLAFGYGDRSPSSALGHFSDEI